MKRISLFFLLSFLTLSVTFGQSKRTSGQSSSKDMNVLTGILESQAYRNGKTQNIKTSTTNALGVTKFYYTKEEVGNAERTTSGAVKFYNKKAEFLGMGEQKPTKEVHIYDRNNRKIVIIEEPNEDWINDIFWTYFY